MKRRTQRRRLCQMTKVRTRALGCSVITGGNRSRREWGPLGAEKEQLEDPLFKLEHVGGDKARAKERAPRVLQIKHQQDAKHADPWKRNRTLRDTLRVRGGP